MAAWPHLSAQPRDKMVHAVSSNVHWVGGARKTLSPSRNRFHRSRRMEPHARNQRFNTGDRGNAPSDTILGASLVSLNLLSSTISSRCEEDRGIFCGVATTYSSRRGECGLRMPACDIRRNRKMVVGDGGSGPGGIYHKFV